MQFHYTEQEIYARKIWRRSVEIRNFMFSNITPIAGVTYRETPEFETYEQAIKAQDSSAARL